MEIRWGVFLIILGSAIVTIIPRVLPLVFLSKITLPKRVEIWLHYIPIAVLASLLAQQLFLQPQINYSDWIAASIAFAAAILTRSLLITVIVGMLAVMMIRTFF